jgi:hypothetical protein
VLAHLFASCIPCGLSFAFLSFIERLHEIDQRISPPCDVSRDPTMQIKAGVSQDMGIYSRMLATLDQHVPKTFKLVVYELMVIQIRFTGHSYTQFRSSQFRTSLFFQVISQRYDNSSATIITSNKAFSDWAEVFAGDAIMASAALDRLLHRCTVINIRGESFRLKEKRQAARSTLAQLVNSELTTNTVSTDTTS